jgi:hypothetical protein
MDLTVAVIIIIVFIIAVIYIINLLRSTPIQKTDTDIQYTPPSINAYKPLLTAPDNRYIYYPNENVYLLPYEYLNFNDPYDLWVYYYYPGFYSSYYRYFYPYIGGYRDRNYGSYGGFIYDENVPRGRGKGNRVTYPGGSDYSGRGIHHPIGHPGRPVNHPKSGYSGKGIKQPIRHSSRPVNHPKSGYRKRLDNRKGH